MLEDENYFKNINEIMNNINLLRKNKYKNSQENLSNSENIKFFILTYI